MDHDYNTQGQKQDMQNNIISNEGYVEQYNKQYRLLKDKFLNLKEIVIKDHQKVDEKFKRKCEQVGSRCTTYKSDHNALAQHGCWNNVILNDISDLVSDDTLEGSALSLLANIGIYVEGQDTEAGRQKSKKTFVQFVNRRNCKKVLSNKKKAW